MQAGYRTEHGWEGGYRVVKADCSTGGAEVDSWERPRTRATEGKGSHSTARVGTRVAAKGMDTIPVLMEGSMGLILMLM